MNSYIVFPKVQKQIDEICLYTEERWGRKQVERYMAGMHSQFQKLADEEIAWKSVDHLFKAQDEIPPALQDMYMSNYEKHVIYFKPLDDTTIGIMNILHGSMDMPSRLL